MAASPSSRPACGDRRISHSADPPQAGRSAHRPACRRACRESRSKSTARYSMHRSFRGTRGRGSDGGRQTSVSTVWANGATRHCATARLRRSVRRYHARFRGTGRLDSKHPPQACPTESVRNVPLPPRPAHKIRRCRSALHVVSHRRSIHRHLRSRPLPSGCGGPRSGIGRSFAVLPYSILRHRLLLVRLQQDRYKKSCACASVS